MRRAAWVLVVLLLMLAGLWWRLSPSPRAQHRPAFAEVQATADVEPSTLRELPLHEDVVDPATPAARATEAQRERTARPSSGAPRTRALVRGRLLIAGSGAPLDEVLKLRLRTGDVSVIEDLVTAPDGSFASTTEFPRGLLLLKVFRPNGDQAADIEGAFDPEAPEEWSVPVPWPTFVHGTVLGRAGEELPRVEVVLVPRAGTGVAEGRTRGGEFKLQGVETGPHTLHLRLGLETCAFEIDVARGPNELGELRAPLAEGSGEVSGRLSARDGVPQAMLLLLGASSGVVAAVEAASGSEAEDESAFRFENVPPGQYRLEVLAFDGRRYEPAALSLSPPATGLEFRAAGVVEAFRLSAVDEDGAPLDTCGLVRLRGQWLRDLGWFARADVESWVALSPGRRPARGVRPEQGEVRAPLAAGHGQAFLFLQAGYDTGWAHGGGVRGGMLAGVEVVADGRPVATSDAEGLALVSLASAPAEIEFRLPGWRLVETSESWLFTSVAMAPE